MAEGGKGKLNLILGELLAKEAQMRQIGEELGIGVGPLVAEARRQQLQAVRGERVTKRDEQDRLENEIEK